MTLDIEAYQIKRIIIIELMVLFIIILFALSISFSLGQEIEDEIIGRFDQDTVRLSPGDTDIVNIKIFNNANYTLNIKVYLYFMETNGHSTGALSEDEFQLKPGEIKNITVTVQSHAHFLQDPEHSDCTIVIKWSRTVSGDEIRVNFDGKLKYKINVIDTFPLIYWIGIALCLILILIIILYLNKKYRFHKKP